MRGRQEEQKYLPEKGGNSFFKNEGGSVKKNFFAVILLLMLVFTGLVTISSGSALACAEAGGVTAVLLTMKTAALMFHTDSRDVLQEVPKGSNICKYLAHYKGDKFVWLLAREDNGDDVSR